MAEDVAGCESGFIGCAFGTQTAGGAGLVIDCLFCTSRGGFQVLVFCCFSCEAVRQKVAVFSLAILTDCFLCAGCFATGAIVGFRVASVTLAGMGVRTVAVRSPCAPIVAEDVAGCEGGFIGCALGAQTADGAGLVVDCFFCAGRGGFQVLLFCCFSSEVMRLHFAVFAVASLADRFCGTGSCSAGAVVCFRVAFVALADAGVRVVAVGCPCTPVVVEDVAGCEGSFIGCALGAQTAGSAGLVIDRFLCAGRGGFQVLFFCLFSGEAVRQGVTVFRSAILADGFLCAGGCAAVMGTFFCFYSAAGIDFPVDIVVMLPVAQRTGVIIGILFADFEGVCSLFAADGAGFVIDCFCYAGRGGFQILVVYFFGREFMV